MGAIDSYMLKTAEDCPANDPVGTSADEWMIAGTSVDGWVMEVVMSG
jgi:hypothetical protein